jgi:hypothetical protein
LVLLLLAATPLAAQDPIKPDRNKYTPAQDVQIGLEAADQVRRELPLLDDQRLHEYVNRIGRELAAAIPPELSHEEFRYSFEVINQKEINAFALPGGPMFLNRGMIEAARSEGEVAGVMGHEIAHVALRHGTAQATKAERFQIGALAGQVLGAIVGGAAGAAIADGSSFGLSTYFLKYSRDYERQADLVGARIMARAGYDPRRMADIFRTIEQQDRGSGGPEWLSSHPNPGNRYDAIQREAERLRVEGSPRSEDKFRAVQARLQGLPPAYTAEQIARARASGGRLPGTGERAERPAGGKVDPPAPRYQNVRLGNVLRLQVPANWRELNAADRVTFAPPGGVYRSASGGTGFTHGLQIGVIPNESHSLQQATDELIDSLLAGNPQLRRQSGGYIREVIGGRAALATDLQNVSEVTGGREAVSLITVPLRGGSLLYLVAVAPASEAEAYAATFLRIKQSIRFPDQGFE